MSVQKLYTQDEVVELIGQSARIALGQLGAPAHLDNPIPSEADISQSQGDEDMSPRLRERVVINGKEMWITGQVRQDLYDRYVDLMIAEGLLSWPQRASRAPLLKDYLPDFFATFKHKQEQNTVVNRDRMIKNHILPKFGNCPLDQISTSDLQKWFNELAQTYAKETLLKIKNTLNPVLDAAVEDRIIDMNPLRSRRLEIGGKDTVGHKALPKEKVEEMKAAIPGMEGREALMLALLCYTGMRFEEVLGLRWDDIDDNWITVQRAVVHPNRNQPVIKPPKTKTSNRIIPYFPELKAVLENKRSTGYVLATAKDPTNETPLSFTEARRVFDHIRQRFDIPEYTAHDFRDTCATIWREANIPLDVIARLLGHAKTETTERKYVKYRPDLLVTVCDTQQTLMPQGSKPLF